MIVIETISRELFDALQTGSVVDPVRSKIGPDKIETAYEVQSLLNDLSIASGRRLTGRKIGLTSPAVQSQLGVDQPDYGAIFSDMVFSDGAVIPSDRLIQPKAEGEIAFVLGEDLDIDHVNPADLLSRIEYAVAGVELVDSRIRDWDITIVDTIADNASCGLLVLGGFPRKLSEVDIADAEMSMSKNGQQVSTGTGRACLGHPLNAACWLANKMIEKETPLREGDIILSGALGAMVDVTPGDEVELSITGFGEIKFEMSHGET